MKKKLLVIIGIITLFVCCIYYVHSSTSHFLNYEEALKIGEEKYLEFLWVVDGVFHDNNYLVNGKSISDDNKLIECRLENNTCIISNMDEALLKLFSQRVNYSKIYSDGVSFELYDKKDHNYIFKNIGNCNNYRMGNSHKLDVDKIENGQINYRVYFNDSKIGELPSREYEKMFTLVYEDGTWKISKAYYHDMCHMDYNIH